ncbi:hypothetical protein BCR37DRAFT_104315 [Protomyces lactucae-debilis]|uniref:Uncharacterized protein n=1 Tax=Protomyces lactucae-debilis TaxID=2754530 RepID=A0A1Y2F5E6_PROLT|nr:uncharacterized protein BCR37DRAFT_104315 [Protomyces lactucae-debilis]ORY79112.1 hypothetical protein BCR37DRAFT_104315 [Protomyces lactucae-debilis]
MTHWSFIILSFCSLLSYKVHAVDVQQTKDCTMSLRFLHKRPSSKPNDHTTCAGACWTLMGKIPDFGKVYDSANTLYCYRPIVPIRYWVNGTTVSHKAGRNLPLASEYLCFCDARLMYDKVPVSCNSDQMHDIAEAVIKQWTSVNQGDTEITTEPWTLCA